MKKIILILLFSIHLMNIGYAQKSNIDKGVIELRKSILKNIAVDDSIITAKKSAVVLANIKLSKTGKFLSCVLLYNDTGKIGQCVSKAISSVSADTWKKFRGIENISVPVLFVYDDGESEFCMDWLDINLKKMETDYLLGLNIKPVITLLSKAGRMR